MRRKQLVLLYVLLKIVERVYKTGGFYKANPERTKCSESPIDTEQRNETEVSSVVMHIHKLPESILLLETGETEA